MARIKTNIRGVVELVGGHDVGKTLAAIQAVYPYDKTVFVDDDIKGDATVEQMSKNGVEFMEYINLGKLRSKLGKTPTPDELLNKVVYPTIDKITEKKREVIIWDTWRIVYESARGHVARNQSKYGNVVQFRGSSTIIQGLVSKVARMIEREAIETLRDNCQLLIITHHLKDNWVENVIVGKIPESSKTFQEICNARIWLRRNPIAKVPIMLFLKRPNLPQKSSTKMKFVDFVPEKITPTKDDDSIWDALERYEKKPIENRDRTPDEIPTVQELAFIQGTLSPEQRAYVKEMVKYQRQELDEVLGKLDEASDSINSPSNGVQLLTMSANRFELEDDEIENILQLKVPDIVKLEGEALVEAWEKVSNASNNE